jgi:glutathione S-transferase
MSPASPYSMLTFPPMINSEACRLVLAHHGVDYREEAHIFGWASVVALMRGGTPEFPLLYGNGVKLAGPRAMTDYFDKNCPPDKKLVPENNLLAAQMEADWNRYNWGMGTSAAVLGYYYLLPDRALMTEPLSRGVPKGEARVIESAYSAFTGQFKVVLNLNAAHARDCLDEIQVLFEETDRRLADDRPYLVGDRLSLSDIALVTAAGPVLLPKGYRSPMPPFERMPATLRRIIQELREHRTAMFVERIYAEHFG